MYALHLAEQGLARFFHVSSIAAQPMAPPPGIPKNTGVKPYQQPYIQLLGTSHKAIRAHTRGLLWDMRKNNMLL